MQALINLPRKCGMVLLQTGFKINAFQEIPKFNPLLEMVVLYWPFSTITYYYR